jgi:hypothetical protein
MTRQPLVTITVALLFAASAEAQTTQATPPGPPPSTTPVPVAPPAPPPTVAPTMPAAPSPPPPEQDVAGTAPEPSTQGEWAYTDQYGWIWVPYADNFVNVPSGGAVPQMYVYQPSVGWTWVLAPWVWGLGPQPYLVVGPGRFAWWGKGFGHWHGFNGEYAQWPARGYYHGGRWYGHRDVFTVPHSKDGKWVGHEKR